MTRTVAIFLLFFWIAGLLAPVYFSMSDDFSSTHWIVEKNEKEQEESEEKEFGEIEFIVNLSYHLSDLSEIQQDPSGTFIPQHIPNQSSEIILPPPEHRA